MAGVLLWAALPILVVHGLLRRRPAALRFQLLLDLVLLALFAGPLLRGLDLDPVRVLAGSPPFQQHAWSTATTLRSDQSDLVLQLHPWWEECRRQLRRGALPRLAPHIGGGVPLLGNGQTGLLAPVMAPVWALGPERGTTVMAVWKVEAAGLGAFLLLHVGWRLRFAAAAVAGLGWALAPFLIGWLLSPLAWSLAALPWAWWLVQRVQRGRVRLRRVAVAGFLLGWLMGAGLNPESAAIVVGSALLTGVVLHPRRALRAGAVAVLAAITAVVLAWPTLVTIDASSKLGAYRDVNPNLTPLPWSVRGPAVVQLLAPAAHGHPARGTVAAPYPWAAGAAGMGGAVLACLLGGWRRRHRALVVAAVASVAVAAVLAYRLPPLDALLVRLPPLDRMTLPRFALLAPWGLLVLGAVGAERLRLHRPARAAWLLVPLLAAAALLGERASWSVVDWALALLPAAAAAAALLAAARRPAWLPALVAGELLVLGIGVLPTAAAVDRTPRPPMVVRLTELVEREGGRILGVGGVLPPNLASRYGLADLRSYDPVRPWPLARLHDLLGAGDPVLPGPLTRAPARLCGAWSVRYLLAPDVFDPGPGWSRIEDGDGLGIWRNRWWLPQVRAVGRAVPLSEEEGWRLLAHAPPELDAVAVVPRGSPPVDASAVALSVASDRMDRLVVRTTCDGPCLVVVARPWAPGWTAEVDGAPAQIVRANLAGIGVVAPAGTHEAELVYRAWGSHGPALASGD